MNPVKFYIKCFSNVFFIGCGIVTAVSAFRDLMNDLYPDKDLHREIKTWAEAVNGTPESGERG